jgi:hypothetical protein
MDMRYRLHVTVLGLLAALAGSARADAPPADPGAPERIEVYPAQVALSSRRSQCQLVVTGHYANGETHDLTRTARYATSDPGIVDVRDAVAMPKRDGTASITVLAGGRTTSVPVEVRGQAAPDPIRFHAETLAVLTKQGCNAGSCHGSPEGKNGFALSLFAYAPHIDKESLVRGGLSRRVNVLEPAESLLLKKPLMRVAHVGGKRLNKSDAAYRILHDWIAEGARADDAGAAQCTQLVVYPPAGRLLHFPHVTQQLSVVAHYSDGTSRDVTPLAAYDVSHKEVAAVDASGFVTGLQRGQAAVTVRYLQHLVSVSFTVVKDVDGFRWTDPPENNYVDRLVHAKLRQLQILPSETCDDGTFLRRVFLDLTGLLPTPDQARAFLADHSWDKRAKLIDQLLDTPEFARFWALQTADLLRVNALTLPDGRAEQLARWLADGYRANRPFDRVATDLLTAAGDAHANPPANYFLAFKTPEELTETTAQLFMGSRVNCAKCHNHPFEHWTQDDYYRLGAVFARVQAKGEAVKVADRGEMKHPATGQVMRPWAAADAAADPAADRREAFARWLTQKGNPYFARVEVNRLWANLLGRGIVRPVDDFRSSNPPANGELLDALARDFEQSGYDRKHIVRVICTSRTYQRSAAVNRFNEADDRLFSRALVRRLSAEQLHDAIALATRDLPAPAALDAEAARRRAELDEELGRIADDFPRWLTATRRQLATLPRWAGVWYEAGPFAGKPTDVPPPERGVDLAARYANGVGWVRHPEWDDAGPVPATNKGGAHYYFRRLHSRAAGPAAVLLTTSQADSEIAKLFPPLRLKVWLNGTPVLDHTDPKRGQPPTFDRVEVMLREGANDLLVKVGNGFGPTSFAFALTGPDGEDADPIGATPEALEVLAAGEPTPEQRHTLLARRQESSQAVKALRGRIDWLTNRAGFATQRPYPEQSEFLRAFGQPKRESPCACERSAEPTVDQALHLLNGEAVAGRLARAAAAYAPLPDGELADELYLSAFARRPTDAERQTVRAYLAKAADRSQGVRDVVWALVNTQAFLFQH